MDRIDRHNKNKSKNGKYVYSGKHIRQKESLLQNQQSNNKETVETKKTDKLEKDKHK